MKDMDKAFSTIFGICATLVANRRDVPKSTIVPHLILTGSLHLIVGMRLSINLLNV